MRRVLSLLIATSLSFAVACSVAAAAVPEQAMKAMERGDYKTALGELRPLAEKGDAEAQFLLGMLHDSGKGVAQDQAAAASWYRKAAKQQHVMSQIYLGILLYSGQGVKQDAAEAARWFQSAAEAGNDQAQFYLGAMCERGAGVPADTSEAIRWLRKSAAQRNTRAMGLLATTLFGRSRDSQDLVDAYAWSHLAAELDPVQATTASRGVIEKYCSGDQKKRGKALMAEWKRKWADESKTRGAAR